MREVEIGSVFECLVQFEWLINFCMNDFLIISEDDRNEILKKIEHLDVDQFISDFIAPNSIFDTKQTKNDESVISCKKEYEIEIAVKVISECIPQLPFQLHTIADVGCGQGNLLTSLPKSCPSVGHFIGIDKNNDLIEKARKRFQESDTLNCQQNSCSSILPSPPTITFISDEFLSSCASLSRLSPSFGFVSLHGCGDLFEQIAREFVENVNCKFMLAIPCCYNLISLPNGNYKCLSRKAEESVQKFSINRNFLMLSCRSPDHQNISKSSLRNITFRVVLQRIFQLNNFKPERIGKIRCKFTTFPEYFQIACRKLFLDASKFDISAHVELLSQFTYPIEQLWTLKCWLGLLAESFIVLDRIHWFREQNIHFQCFEIFDRTKSNRNICFQAQKD